MNPTKDLSREYNFFSPFHILDSFFDVFQWFNNAKAENKQIVLMLW